MMLISSLHMFFGRTLKPLRRYLTDLMEKNFSAILIFLLTTRPCPTVRMFLKKVWISSG